MYDRNIIDFDNIQGNQNTNNLDDVINDHDDDDDDDHHEDADQESNLLRLMTRQTVKAMERKMSTRH